MIQTQENDEKPHFGPNLGPLSPNSGRQFFFKNLANRASNKVKRLTSYVIGYSSKTEPLNTINLKFCKIFRAAGLIQPTFAIFSKKQI